MLRAAALSAEVDEERHTVLVRQAPFAIVASMLALALLIAAPERLTEPPILAAIILVAVTTLASAVVPWHRVNRWWHVVIPLADMVVIALPFIGAHLNVVAGLALPVLWMARAFGAGGVLVAVASSTVIVWGPQMFGQPITELSLPRLIVMPPVLAAIATYVYLADDRTTARHALLLRQSATLERTLAEARRRRVVLEGLLNTIDVGVVAMDRDGRIWIRNRAQGELAPMTPPAGRTVADYAPGRIYSANRRRELPPEESPLVRAGRGERFERELVWVPRDDGTWRALSASAAPLLDEHGRWDGAVVVYQDLTPELMAMAQQDAFVASVSHELRTPLTSILGFAEVLADDPELKPEQHGYVGVIERNARRLLLLIADLLTVGQLERGALHLAREPVRLRGVLEESIEGLTPQASEQRVRIELDVPGDLVVLGDASRLSQIFDNLLSNAVKYTRENGSVAVIGARDGDEVVVVVRDDGIGIAPDDLPRIFDRFFRADAVRESRIPGTGLGLHIVRRLAEAHGGRVDMTSELGVGTEVRVTLPGGSRA